MGSILYDFLTESFLFHDAAVESNYQHWNDKELKKELARYREFGLSNFNSLQLEILSKEDCLRVFHPDERASVEVLKQTALYVEQFVLCDPLFPLTHEPSGPSAAMTEYFGAVRVGLDRKRLSEAIRFLKTISAMIAADFVKLLPTSFFSEPPKEIPIYYSENNYEDGIPSPVLNFFRQRASVSSLERLSQNWVTRGELYPSRGIAVQFPGENGGTIYQLMEMEVLKTKHEGDKRHMEFRQYLPDTPPSDEQFRLWVSQSINRAANRILQGTLREIGFAANNGASLLTHSPFKAELLTTNFDTQPSLQGSVLNSLLELDLPFLEDLDVGSLMDVRTQDGEAFHNFRIELEKQLRELRLIKDPEQLRLKRENIVHELTETQVSQVGQKIQYLKKKAFADAGILIGGLAATVQSGGWSLLASTLAAANGYKTVQEYFQNVRVSPAFFLWKIKDKAKRGQLAAFHSPTDVRHTRNDSAYRRQVPEADSGQ